MGTAIRLPILLPVAASPIASDLLELKYGGRTDTNGMNVHVIPIPMQRPWERITPVYVVCTPVKTIPNTVKNVPRTRRMRRCPVSYSGPTTMLPRMNMQSCREPIHEIREAEIDGKYVVV